MPNSTDDIKRPNAKAAMRPPRAIQRILVAYEVVSSFWKIGSSGVRHNETPQARALEERDEDIRYECGIALWRALGWDVVPRWKGHLEPTYRLSTVHGQARNGGDTGDLC